MSNVYSIFILLSILFISYTKSYSQVYSKEDVEICNQKFLISVEDDLKDQPINDVILKIGESFLGTEYLAHALEENGDEQLVINLSGLDCTTLVENSLALARCVKLDSTSFENYLHELQFIRYRDGIVDGFPSRLHYFSDWISDNIFKGVIEDETKQLGGIPIKFNLNFMSTHPDSYKQLKENPDLIPVIQMQEEAINSREYYYIPKDEFESKEKLISSGEIIAITTTVEGLDIGHIGIAIKMDDGRIHLLHAPNVNTKVQITEEPLADYLMKYKRHSGVIVLKVLEPNNLLN
jgi:hypothetical protein